MPITLQAISEENYWYLWTIIGIGNYLHIIENVYQKPNYCKVEIIDNNKKDEWFTNKIKNSKIIEKTLCTVNTFQTKNYIDILKEHKIPW